MSSSTSRWVVRAGAALVSAAAFASSCAGEDGSSPGHAGGSSSSGGSGARSGAGSATGSGGHSTSSGGAGGSAPSGSGGAGGTTSSGAGGSLCPPLAMPPFVPAGWVEYTDWSCKCRFYVPGSKAALPAPIGWEPCPNAPKGVNCRRMMSDWTQSASPVAVNPSFDRNPDGSAVLDFVRITREGDVHTMHLTADADGPVRNAMIKSWVGESVVTPGCYLINYDMAEGKYVRQVVGSEQGDPGSQHNSQGAFGGDVDAIHPPVIFRHDGYEPITYGYAVGMKWFIQGGQGYVLTAHSWDLAKAIFVASQATDPDHLTLGDMLVVKGALFYDASGDAGLGINVWVESHGARPFIRWVGDSTQGAYGFGTDGVDMVWSYGKQPIDGGDFAVRSIMTSPFTTDPATVKPRRLRSQELAINSGPAWVVGCGYAARNAPWNTTLVVRLSDGRQWTVPPAPPDDLLFQMPIGLTCTEVFGLGQVGGKYTIARVRLDSLGPGVPPD